MANSRSDAARALADRRILLWDLDGTLVDSRPDLAAAGNVARAACGLPPLTVETVGSFVGDGLAKLLERLCPDADAEQMALARSAFENHYRAHCVDGTTVYPGIPALLGRLASRFRMAVVTNKPTDFSRRILDGLGLAPHIDLLVGGDCGAKKPDPMLLFAACAGCGGGPEVALMIGDHRTDLLAAEVAGIPAVFCAWGIGQVGEGRPLATVDSVADLGRLLGAS